jgi:hypothetical protein
LIHNQRKNTNFSFIFPFFVTNINLARLEIKPNIITAFMNQNDFVSLISPFKDKVFRLSKRLLVSTEEAEDATQEVLVKLWDRKENLEKL